MASALFHYARLQALAIVLFLLILSLMLHNHVPVRRVEQQPTKQPRAETSLHQQTKQLLFADHPPRHTHPSNAPLGENGNHAASLGCESFPDTQNILLVMKTGTTEAYDKLPIHLLTTLKCVNDSILFSDTNMEIGQHHIIDALETIDQVTKDINDDFILYKQLKEYKKLGLDPEPLKDPITSWHLDKYKFIPMLQKAWEYRKDATWYFFMEADTGINWRNLRLLLDQLEPKESLYLGSPTMLDIEFAHGGTGYVISGEAMRKAIEDNPSFPNAYNAEVENICCGDRMPAKILLDKGIKLTRTWPMFNGENPVTLAFRKEQWCQPVITMHHLTPQEVSRFWNFQNKWSSSGNERPILWMDVYAHFVDNNLEKERGNWINWAGDVMYDNDSKDFKILAQSQAEGTDIKTSRHCAETCESIADCLSWVHHNVSCSIGRTFKLGQSRVSKDEYKWTSGWHLDRIKQFREDMGNCSKGVDWRITKPGS